MEAGFGELGLSPHVAVAQHQLQQPPPAHLSLPLPTPSTPSCTAEGIGSPRVTVGADIHDKEFFPELPSLLTDVAGRLGRLMQLVAQMEAAAAAAAETEPDAPGGGSAGQGSLTSSLVATEASEASLRAASSKKLKWADGQATPPVAVAGQDGEEAADGEAGGEEGEEGESSAAAAEGEKALRKGFCRRTWAGPAWLDAVSAGKVRAGECSRAAAGGACNPASEARGCLPSPNHHLPFPSIPCSLQPLTAALRKQLGARSPGVAAGSGGGPALSRVVGYAEEPSSGDERAGTNPFDLAGSSDDELDGEEGGLVDRWVGQGGVRCCQQVPAAAMRSASS